MGTSRILVVDDEPAVLDVVGRMLCSRGYEVLPAAGARQALEIVRHQPPIDLVLSDVVMPGMRGPMLVTEITRVSPATATVLMSGYVPDAAELPIGIPLVRKPVTLEALIPVIEATLARSQQIRREVGKPADTLL